jgi:predicted metal-dependent enzyme (double-stranded beta helix superfamily)
MRINKLLDFVHDFSLLLETRPTEQSILTDGKALLAELVASDVVPNLWS